MLTRRYQFLLLLLPLLGLIVWLEPGLDKPKINALTPLQPNQIHTIQISNKRGKLIQLQRENSHWMMLQPTQGEANNHRVEELLGISQTPSHFSFAAEDDKLAEYGLKPAPITLKINELQLLFGDIDPVYQRRYVQIGNRIHLIDDGFQHHLLAPPAAFSGTGE